AVDEEKIRDRDAELRQRKVSSSSIV
ncbi:unnamed protein product, partial [Rotaria socialis]